MSETNLFSPIKLGAIELPHRIAMAPMTRSRATADGVVGELQAEYYAQRASAAPIITEATQISLDGKGYIDTPGIHTPDHVAGWRKVTNAVHEAGGVIFLQLWHVGRVSHTSFQPNGQAPVSSSAGAADIMSFTTNGPEPASKPRALELDEIRENIRQWGISAQLAKDAGFDGVELHGANGYLIDQFLRDGVNQRRDAYGGSIENRLRFALEATEAVVNVWGPGRVGFRASPVTTFNDMRDSNPSALFSALAREFNQFDLAYLHVVEPYEFDPSSEGFQDGVEPIAQLMRENFNGPFMINMGYTKETGNRVIQEGRADLVSFGVPFLANPDLPARFRRDAELNEPDHSTFYGGDETDFTDYPSLEEVSV